jgi:HlyD family secretion protein
MRKIIIVVVILILAGGGVAAWYRFGATNNGEADKLVLFGNVDIREVDLAFEIPERIESMLVEEGALVKRGQVVATLDLSELQARYEGARARMAAQEQVLARLEAGSRRQEIDRARAELEAARAEAVNATRSYARQRELLEDKAGTEQDLDDARAAAVAAAARLAAASETLQLVLEGPRRQDIASARETLRALRAELALAKEAIDNATLTSPADGVIRTRVLEPGDMASPDRPVYTLALSDPVWVRVYIEEPDLGKVWPGMKAAVTTDSYPGKRYPAWLGYISPTAEFTPKTVQTREVRTDLVYLAHVYVENADNELRLGMPAEVIIPLDQARPSDGETDGPNPGGTSHDRPDG